MQLFLAGYIGRVFSNHSDYFSLFCGCTLWWGREKGELCISQTWVPLMQPRRLVGCALAAQHSSCLHCHSEDSCHQACFSPSCWEMCCVRLRTCSCWTSFQISSAAFQDDFSNKFLLELMIFPSLCHL